MRAMFKSNIQKIYLTAQLIPLSWFRKRSIMTLRDRFIITLPKQFPGTHLAVPLTITIPKRMMLKTRCMIQAARAALNVLDTISKDTIIHSTANNVEVVLGTALGSLCLDDQKGILQQKTSLAKHMIPHKFPLMSFYDNIISQYKNLSIGATPRIGSDLVVDPRSLNEVKVIEQLISRYGSGYLWIIATGDSAASFFKNQVQQSHPDVWAAIKCITMQNNIAQYNYLAYDEKSGTNMFKHSTKGTLGYITYDSEGIHSFLKDQVCLKEYNQIRITNIGQALRSDGLWKSYEIPIKEFSNEFYKTDKKDISKLCKLQENMQDFLVCNVQTNPLFQRNISMVFTQRVQFEDLPQINDFSNRLAFYLKKCEQSNDLYRDDRFYDLNVIGHKKVIYKSMLCAYEDVIDPLIRKKIKYVCLTQKITLDPDLLELLRDI